MPSIVYRTAALTSLSDSVSYITFLFLDWCIASVFSIPHFDFIYDNEGGGGRGTG